MTAFDWIGTLAGTLTTVAFIPQVLKTWRSRSAHDISLFMFILFSCGVLLWLVYGVVLHSWPMIIANGITLLLALSMLYLKVMDVVAARSRLQQAEQRTL
ncbi:MAG: SemiSWEET transporter [Gammaproteobacteria bacterium]|nr:SemiSWEET transporter [Gammaproteobacteria bacterium]